MAHSLEWSHGLTSFGGGFRPLNPQILSAGFSSPRIGLEFERNLLPLSELREAGAFDGADVHEHVVAAIIRLNETVALR